MNGLALCAGIGGIELGLKRAIRDYRTVCYVERDYYATAILAKRMDEKALCRGPIWDDIKTFDGQVWRGIVDIVTAGFPCQPFSVAGSRKGLDDERWIWPDIARIIGEIEASFIFLENVPGFISLGLESVLNDLASMGYHARWACIPATAVGASHERERFFLLAYSDSKRLEVSRIRRRSKTPFTSIADDFRWEPEPSMDRVVNGISVNVDRIRCLGNAVVPAQAELAWRILTS